MCSSDLEQSPEESVGGTIITNSSSFTAETAETVKTNSTVTNENTRLLVDVKTSSELFTFILTFLISLFRYFSEKRLLTVYRRVFKNIEVIKGHCMYLFTCACREKRLYMWHNCYYSRHINFCL